MRIREYLNERPRVAYAIFGPILVLSVVVVVWWFLRGAPREPQPRAYFYDQNTGELFVLPAHVTGPVETEPGDYHGMPAGVRAHVFCCGQFGPGVEKFVGYLQIPSESLPRDQWPEGFEPDPETEQGDFLIRRTTDEQWCAMNSAEGIRIFTELPEKCRASGKRLTPVIPIPK